MKLYSNYLNQIDKAINPQHFHAGREARTIFNLHEGQNYFKKGFSYTEAVAPETGLEKLALLLDLPLNTPSFGDHPDFASIKETGIFEKHYAVSVFQDVKGSTSFFKKFTPEQIYVIIQTIVVATSHTHGLFRGHVQRLQYDGVFSYFVRKGMERELALYYSLCATAFSTYFVRYELKDYFKESGLDKTINVRTGVDFGNDKDVMWVAYGLNGCSEVSTNSLHTSLAFKIQAKAQADKICVGANVVKTLPSLSEYFDKHRDSDGTLNDKIWEDGNGNAYTYYDFNWEKFLLDTFSNFVYREGGKLTIDYDADVNEIHRRAKLRHTAMLTKLGLGHLDEKGSFSQKRTNISIPTASKYAPE